MSDFQTETISEESFWNWLSGKVNSKQLSEFYRCNQRLNEYFVSHHGFCISVFNEIVRTSVHQTSQRIQQDLNYQKHFNKYERKFITNLIDYMEIYITENRPANLIDAIGKNKFADIESNARNGYKDGSNTLTDAKTIETKSSEIPKVKNENQNLFVLDNFIRYLQKHKYSSYEINELTSIIKQLEDAAKQLKAPTKKIVNEDLKKTRISVNWLKYKIKGTNWDKRGVKKGIDILLDYFDYVDKYNDSPTLKNVNAEKVQTNTISGSVNSNTKIHFSEVNQVSNPQTDSTVEIIDFNKIGDVSFTQPISINYFGTEKKVNSWRSLFEVTCTYLLRDFPNVFLKMREESLQGVGGFWLVDDSHKRQLRVSHCIGAGYYIEVNRSSTEFLRNIKKLLDRCEVANHNVVIKIIRSKTKNDKRIKPNEVEIYTAPNNLSSENIKQIPIEITSNKKDARTVLHSDKSNQDTYTDPSNMYNKQFIDYLKTQKKKEDQIFKICKALKALGLWNNLIESDIYNKDINICFRIANKFKKSIEVISVPDRGQYQDAVNYYNNYLLYRKTQENKINKSGIESKLKPTGIENKIKPLDNDNANETNVILEQTTVNEKTKNQIEDISSSEKNFSDIEIILDNNNINYPSPDNFRKFLAKQGKSDYIDSYLETIFNLEKFVNQDNQHSSYQLFNCESPKSKETLILLKTKITGTSLNTPRNIDAISLFSKYLVYLERDQSNINSQTNDKLLYSEEETQNSSDLTKKTNQLQNNEADLLISQKELTYSDSSLINKKIISKTDFRKYLNNQNVDYYSKYSFGSYLREMEEKYNVSLFETTVSNAVSAFQIIKRSVEELDYDTHNNRKALELYENFITTFDTNLQHQKNIPVNDFQKNILEPDIRNVKTAPVLSKEENDKPLFLQPDSEINALSIEEDFCNYLKIERNMAESSCRSFVSSIHRAEQFAREHNYSSTALFTNNYSEAEKTRNELIEDPFFQEFNKKQNFRFTNAISKLMIFHHNRENAKSPQTEIKNETIVENKLPTPFSSIEEVIQQKNTIQNENNKMIEKSHNMEENIQVGKYTLESLTTGMYSDPKIIYREYIQNSVDALEMAVQSNLIEPQSMRIDIIVDAENSYISIRDNGTGINSSSAISTLVNIGSSKKRHSNNRGFRGIGRLGGMSYCGRLVFTTTAEEENTKTIVEFDCKKLKQLLVPGANEDMDLATVLANVTQIHHEDEKKEKHYFLVELFDVNGLSDLLNIETAKNYIAQVAPLPYKSREFVYSPDVHLFLKENGYELEEFPIFIGETNSDLEPIYKPNCHRFHSDRNNKKNDEILSLRTFPVIIDGELYALGWYGVCNWLGSLSEQDISGIRVRKGNILIGDNKTLNSIFKETRFNGWTQGELFVVTDRLIPNARRDDFEQNEAYYKLIKVLQDGIGTEISKAIREASALRNDSSAKVITEVQKQVSDATVTVAEGFNSSVDKSQLLNKLEAAEEALNKTKVREDLRPKKEELQQQLAKTIEEVSDSSNYKINQIITGVDKRSKKILEIVSDILSEKLAKPLVDDIIEEIVTVLNGKKE